MRPLEIPLAAVTGITITADRNSPGHQVAGDEVRARGLLDGEVHAMREPAISGRASSPKPMPWRLG